MSKKIKKVLCLSIATLSLLALGNETANASTKHQKVKTTIMTTKKVKKNSQPKNSKQGNKKSNSNSSKNNNKNTTKKTNSSKNNVTKSKKTSTTKSLKNQQYTSVLTGKNPIFNKPGSTSGAKVTVSKANVQKLIKQNTTFMAYKVMTLSNGYKYYKIVSSDHSVRGWIYTKGLKLNSSSANTNSNNDDSIKNASKNMKKVINYVNAAKDDISQAKAAVNNKDANSANNLIVQANKQISLAQNMANKLTNSDESDDATLRISEANSSLQEVQDLIQNKLSTSDSTLIDNANSYMANAYSDLNTVKNNIANANSNKYDTAVEIINALTAMNNANSTASQINDVTTKQNMQNNIDNATKYMNVVIADANKTGVNAPTKLPTDDTDLFTLVSQYITTAQNAVNDLSNKSNGTLSQTQINTDTTNAQGSLKIAMMLVTKIKDSPMATEANKSINQTSTNLNNALLTINPSTQTTNTNNN